MSNKDKPKNLLGFDSEEQFEQAIIDVMNQSMDDRFSIPVKHRTGDGSMTRETAIKILEERLSKQVANLIKGGGRTRLC